MTQSRAISLLEAVTNIAVGYGVAVLTQMLVFPLFGAADLARAEPRSAPCSPPCPSFVAVRSGGP